ncbi:MAG: DNA-protecting protein DprA [Pseudomonadota bacterium]
MRLSATPGVGNKAARQLLAAFGLPERIFSQSKKALTQVVGGRLADSLLNSPADLDDLLDATLAWMQAGEQQGVPVRAVWSLADAAYPPALLNLDDPPLLIYALGQAGAVGRSLAVVGSRNPTAQGKDSAYNFARALAEGGMTVVSGLALGVDAAAHAGALEGAPSSLGLATVAVVGTGLDRVYPKRNLALAHRIAERGLILSEYPIGTPPLSENFPRRNRIIAALSQGTLVVEAALQSGSLITARLAAEQGKEVFAIPGSIHSDTSRGCHALIRQGAKLVETVQDILEELQGVQHRHMVGEVSTPGDLESDESLDPVTPQEALLAALGYDPVGVDALQARTGLATADLLAQLMELQLANEVARLPGGLYQRLGRA